MQTYISLLRGINVSGQKMIKMEALSKMYEALGFKNVRTYIQSGNVIFQNKKTTPANLEKKIFQKILAAFNFEVPVIVNDINELKIVLKKNPFINIRKEDISRLYVTFLSHEAEQTNIDKINKEIYAPDEFIISGRTIYLFCPISYGNSKLNNNFFENKLKVVATTRNWKTVIELVNIGESMED